MNQKNFIIVLVVSQLISFSGFGFVQLFTILSETGPQSYVSAELSYVVLSFTAKALFGVITIQQSLGSSGKYDSTSFFKGL